MPKNVRIRGSRFRLVIPHLQQFGKFPARDHRGLERLKRSILEKLHEHQVPRGLERWCIAWQTHPVTGYAHIDLLLIYDRQVNNSLKHYDYLHKHGDLTRYRTVNLAILKYGTKEDPGPLMNFSPDRYLLKSRASKSDSLRQLMRDAMSENPFNFDPAQWLVENDLYGEAGKTSLFTIIAKVKHEQLARCHNLLTKRPGIAQITPELVQTALTPKQQKIFRSWSGYQTIVDHINQIAKFGWNRPHKTSNLLLVGRPNTGKTTLCMQIQRHCSVYPLGVKSWFPAYRSQTYQMLTWDEFNLQSYSYPLLLKLLEGRPMALPIKGGHVKRSDNQLIIMTSNLSLRRHILLKFKKRNDRLTARDNLAPRITEVKIPPKRDLFLLVKLIRSAKSVDDIRHEQVHF